MKKLIAVYQEVRGFIIKKEEPEHLVLYKNSLYRNICSKKSDSVHLISPYDWMKKSPIIGLNKEYIEVIHSTFQLIVWFANKYRILLGLIISVVGLLIKFFEVAGK